jgi:glycosyltransferase involved in cell wall biosynthesis
MAVEHFDFSKFDLVISSSSSFAKGIIVPPHTVHVCYCHTPTRFLWQERIGYLNDLPQPKILRMLLPPVLHNIRTWDRMAAERPDLMLTNSHTSRTRIKRYYNRDAEVIYPPVDVERIPLSSEPGTYWLAGGRLVGYKRFDLIVRAFAKLDLPLKIFGVGPEARKLQKMAGPRTEFLGRVGDEEKIRLYQGAFGFIHPQDEDFGITAVEAMAAGKPVITYKKGGGAETVVPGVTGIHMDTQSWESIGDAIIRFKTEKFNPQIIRNRAEEFSINRFRQQILACLEKAIAPHEHLG